MFNPWFTKGRYLYPTPERLSPNEIARRRAERLTGVYQREAEKLRPLTEPVQARRRASLYPDEARLIEQRLKLLQDKAKASQKAVEPLRPVRRANRLFLAAIAGTLNRQRLQAQQLSRGVFRRAKATAAASGQFYDPYLFSKNQQASDRRFNQFTSAVAHHLARSSGLFKLGYTGLPCIDRAVRREVLFARGHGGKGHRVPHKFNKGSFTPC